MDLFACSFICLLCWSASMVSLLILSSCIHSQSSMPNNADPFPGAGKKSHQSSKPILIVTLHTLICGIHEFLYACNTTFLSIDLSGLTILVWGKSVLNILMAIKLPSLPASTLYLHIVVVWLLLVFSFAAITRHCYGG